MEDRRHYLATALVALLSVVAFATGCGHSGRAGSAASGSSSGSTQLASGSTGGASTPKASLAEFRSRANAICQALNTELEASKPSGTSLLELLRFTPLHASMERKSLAKLEALQAPPSLAGPWQKMISYRKQLLNQLAELARDARSHNQAQIKQLAASKLTLHTGLLMIGAQLGATACAKLG